MASGHTQLDIRKVFIMDLTTALIVAIAALVTLTLFLSTMHFLLAEHIRTTGLKETSKTVVFTAIVNLFLSLLSWVSIGTLSVVWLAREGNIEDGVTALMSLVTLVSLVAVVCVIGSAMMALDKLETDEPSDIDSEEAVNS